MQIAESIYILVYFRKYPYLKDIVFKFAGICHIFIIYTFVSNHQIIALVSAKCVLNLLKLYKGRNVEQKTRKSIYDYVTVTIVYV